MNRDSNLYSIFSLLGAVTLFFTSQKIQKPYMDEYFHYDQMDHYLKGDFSYWNDKLTTPPGTYILLYPFLKLDEHIGFQHKLVAARLANSEVNILFMKIFRLIFGNIILYFLQQIFSQIKSKERFNISYYILFAPTIYFFSHLFYTDSASLAMCLGMYHYSKQGQYALSGIFGLFSILIRQTNIIWVIYVCLITYIDQNQKKFEDKVLRIMIQYQIIMEMQYF